MFRLFCSLSCVAFIACGPGSGSMTSEPPVDGGSNTPVLDPADCAAFAASLAAAGTTCGTPLPSGAQAMFEQWCRKGVTAAQMCGGDPSAGLDCFATPDANDWQCVGAFGPYPACGGDLAAALGAFCVIAMGNPQCASGIACDFDADCSNGTKCNSATGQCVGENAYCVGLPCRFDADCPNGEKCNGAEGACVAE
ncbi:MAG: hypothetical protein ACKV2T_07820 [Kofleriaceae bacterium]